MLVQLLTAYHFNLTALILPLATLIFPLTKTNIMNNLFRGILAGVGAKKLGGGCISTILIFIVIWVVLGQCE